MSLCHDVIIMPHPILINYGLDMAQFIANLHFFCKKQAMIQIFYVILQPRYKSQRV